MLPMNQNSGAAVGSNSRLERLETVARQATRTFLVQKDQTSTRLERLGAIARVRAMAEAAACWADATEFADGWDAARFAWLAQRAAEIARCELERARRDLGGADVEVLERFVLVAQDDAQQALQMAKDAPAPALDSCVVQRLREAESQAHRVWLYYPDNGQPEARLEAANLKAAYDRARHQHRIAALVLALLQVHTTIAVSA